MHALTCKCRFAAAFDAAYVLAFLLAGTFLVYAVLILVMRNVFVREEREGKLAPNKTAATAPAAATSADTTPAVSRPAPELSHLRLALRLHSNCSLLGICLSPGLLLCNALSLSRPACRHCPVRK